MSKKRNSPISRSTSKPGRSVVSKDKRGLSDRTLAILIGLFGVLLYANTLSHGFVLDDNLIFTSNEYIQKGFAGIPDIFTQPYRENCLGGCLYRPVTLTTFVFDWMMSPNNPEICHLMNILWYAATGVLLFLTLRRMLPQKSTLFSVMACVLFVAHPVHTEVVANIKSRDEILSLFFILLSLHQFARWHLSNQRKSILFAAFAYLAALLSKESAITALAVFPFVGWMFFRKSFFSSLKSGGWVVIPLGLFFILRGYALNGLVSPAIHMFDNPLVEAQGTEWLGTAFLIFLKYLLLLVFPLHLISDYSYNTIPLQSLSSPTSIIGAVIYLALGVYAIYGLIRKQITGLFALAFLASISLYSQIVFLLGVFMGERLLFLPSLWFILGVTTILTPLWSIDLKTFSALVIWKHATFVQRSMLIGFAVIILGFSLQTILRNQDWASNYTLMKADVEKSPNSIRLNESYAEQIYQEVAKGGLTPDELKRQLDLSEQYSKKSIAIHPDVTAYSNLANIYTARNQYPEALSYYKKIKEISDDQVVWDTNIASLLIYWAKEESEKNDNLSLSMDLLTQAIEYNPENGEIWQCMGLNYFRLGKLAEARSSLEKAYSLAPGSASIKSDLIRFYINQGMQDKADSLR